MNLCRSLRSGLSSLVLCFLEIASLSFRLLARIVRRNYLKAKAIMNESQLFRPKQVADFLGIAQSTLAKMRLTGGGPRYSKIGPRLVAYDPSDLTDWVNSRKRQSTSEQVSGE